MTPRSRGGKLEREGTRRLLLRAELLKLGYGFFARLDALAELRDSLVELDGGFRNLG